MTKVKDHGIARVLRQLFFGGSAFDAVGVVTDNEPDTSFLMEYVYGTLASNMHEMHLTHHLIHDDLTNIVRPNKLLDIQDDFDEETGTVSASAGAAGAESVEMSFREISSKKFGKLIYRLESSVTGGTVYSEKTVVAFHEQVVIFQSEKQILFWPLWYSQTVIPKYKFKSMTTAQADSTWMVYLGFFCFIVGAALCSTGAYAVGVVLILLSFPLFYLPCILSSYEVKFEIATVKDTGIAW